MADPRLWFRMYTEFAFDPKVQLLDETLQRRYVMLLCAAASGMSPFHAVSEAEFLLRIPVSECEKTRSILVSRGLIAEDWFPVAWDKRQFESDTSTSRVKRFRQRQKAVTEAVTETPSEQSRAEQSRAEQKRERAGARAAEPAAGLDTQAWSRWIEYRREIRKPIKPASMQAAQRKLAGLGADQAAVVEQSVANGWQGLFPLKLNGGHAGPEPRKTRFDQLQETLDNA